MLLTRTFILSLLLLLCTNLLFAEEYSIPKEKLGELDGNWHLRIADGMEARKARTILEFDFKKMTISGFDGCNKISGILVVSQDNNMTAKLIATKMACRRSIHAYASKRLHETLAEGFTIMRATSNGVDGIMLKSAHHTLFFKKMGGEVEKSSGWQFFDLDLDFDYDFDFGFGSDSKSDTNETNNTSTTGPKQN